MPHVYWTSLKKQDKLLGDIKKLYSSSIIFTLAVRLCDPSCHPVNSSLAD
jgi:hypothetical protein